MEIKEITEKMGKTIKKNKGLVIGGLVGGVALLALTGRGGSEDSSQWIVPTGTSGYPDVGTNSNVIIDEVNNHTSTEVGGIKDYIKDGVDDIVDNANNNIDTATPDISNGSSGGGGIINYPDTSKGTITQVGRPVPSDFQNWLNSGSFMEQSKDHMLVDNLPNRTIETAPKTSTGIKMVDTSTSKKTGNSITVTGRKTTQLGVRG